MHCLHLLQIPAQRSSQSKLRVRACPVCFACRKSLFCMCKCQQACLLTPATDECTAVSCNQSHPSDFWWAQVAGSEWKLVEEGKSAEVQDQGPQFSTWEDVMNAKSGTNSPGSRPGAAPQQATDDELYRHAELPMQGCHCSPPHYHAWLPMLSHVSNKPC